MVWGAVIGAGVSLISGSMAKHDADVNSRKNREKREEWTKKYNESLDAIEAHQISDLVITNAVNEQELARYRRDISRASSQQAAAAEAAAYQSGVSGGSSMQGFFAGLSIDALTAVNDATFAFNLNLLQGERETELNRLKRQADYEASQANIYGGALQASQARSAQFGNQILSSAGALAGALAANYWNSGSTTAPTTATISGAAMATNTPQGV